MPKCRSLMMASRMLLVPAFTSISEPAYNRAPVTTANMDAAYGECIPAGQRPPIANLADALDAATSSYKSSRDGEFHATRPEVNISHGLTADRHRSHRDDRRDRDRDYDRHRDRGDRDYERRDRDRGDRDRDYDRSDRHRHRDRDYERRDRGERGERDYDRGDRGDRRRDDRGYGRDDRGYGRERSPRRRNDDRDWRRSDRDDWRGGGGGGRGGGRGRHHSPQRSPTPPDAIPLEQRQVEPSLWDIAPPAFEGVSAMEAKMTGELRSLP